MKPLPEDPKADTRIHTSKTAQGEDLNQIGSYGNRWPS
jgi:hypothetical protein